ncbi:hypothetical protein RBB78_03445 [Tunturiibacter empetritectus]|uniref:hypothetical protein n=1 Tax=Tunturiibacter empetritectus TaxID=3069691 RepID=UPI003D9B1197
MHLNFPAGTIRAQPIKNKVEIRGVFFRTVRTTVFSPRSPRISPRSHQQKTTSTQHAFLKHPLKHQQKCETQAQPWLRIFFAS